MALLPLRHRRAATLLALCLLAAEATARPPAIKAEPAAEPVHAAARDARSPHDAAVVDPRDGIARAIEFTVTLDGNGVYGSGVLLVPSEGLVLTAYHVIEEMTAPRVTFSDGRTAVAHVLDSDRVLDVALLQVPPQPRGAPTVGDATALRPGEEVYAVGCPRRLGSTVSRGIVSYVGRPMDGARYIQTDLPINDGNSGGPVVNARGEVVGMMSFILRRAQGISFALPINYAADRFARVPAPASDPTYVDRFRRWLRSAPSWPTLSGPDSARPIP